MATPEQRLKDLRAAKIVNLPTRRRLYWYRAWAVLSVFAAICFAYFAVTDNPVKGIVAALFLLTAYACVGLSRQTEAQLRAPQAATFDEPTAWQSLGGDGLEGVGKVALSGASGVLETGIGIVAKKTDRLWGLLKPRQLARWQADVATDLEAGERILVSAQAQLVPHGLRRALLPLTLWFAAVFMYKRGVVTVTDRRLLFHRRPWARRGRRRYLYRSLPLAELEVLQWYEGAYVEARTHVLIVRGPGGRVVRINIDRVWAEEAQWVFDLVASSSRRPPAILAARWTSGIDPRTVAL